VDFKNIQSNLRSLVIHVTNYRKHTRWNEAAVSNLDDQQTSRAASELPQFKIHVKKFAGILRHLQDIVFYSGFKKNQLYITDIYEQDTDSTKFFFIGFMYPLSGVISPAFSELFKGNFQGFYNGDNNLKSVVESLVAAFNAHELNRMQSYNLNTSIDYAMVTFTLSPRFSFDSPLDEGILNAINLDLNSAYNRISPGSIFTDEDPLEA